MRIQHYLPALLFLLAPTIAAAQQTGTIVGRTVDLSTGNPLPGATVLLADTRYGTASDAEGNFRLPSVPYGSYTLEISYIGYIERTMEITLDRKVLSLEEIGLVDEVIEGGTVTVRGIRTGQAAALNQQRSADNIVNIVSSTQIGRFPDANTAEAIQRIPGVTLQRDQGEGRYVQLRGSDPRLTNVTINGEQVPAPEGEVRFVALDVIPSDQLAAIEVSKALLPNQDADGVGGSINLRTAGAFDDDLQIRGSVAGGYSDIVADANYKAALSVGERVGDGSFGYLVSGSYSRANRGSDNIELEYTDEEIGGSDVTVLGDMQLRDYVITRERLGVTTTLDYRLSDDSELRLDALYNRFGDQEFRRRLRLRYDKGDYNSATSISDAEAERELKNRYEVQDIYSLQLGANGPIGPFRAESSISYSYAKEEEPDRRDIAFTQEGVDYGLDLADPSFPVFSITNGANLNDAGSYEFEDLVIENNLTTDRNLTAALDLELPVSIGDKSAAFTFGGKFRSKQKDRTNDVKILDGFDGQDLTLADFEGTFVPENFLDGRYAPGRGADPDRVDEFYEANTASFEEDTDGSREDTDPANYEATETTIAGYAMGRIELDRLMILAGARYEQIGIDYTGNSVTFDDDGDYEKTEPISGSNDFGKLFPMVHLRYGLAELTNLRLAWTNSLSRPNYYDLTPYRIVFREDEELSIGNPELGATTAMNLDLMAEHYFRSVGVLSAGLFFKQLDNFVYEQTGDVEGGTLGAEFDGYEFTQPTNGETATLYGVEVNWQQQLTFLPGPLDGLGIYANYTWTTSEAELPGRDGTIRMPGQAEHVGNVAISYEKAGFSGRLALNHAGSFIDAVGDSPEEDVFYDNHTQLDFSASQRLTDNFSVYAELLNLTDAPLRYFVGDSSRPIVQEFYSWWGQLGFRFDF